MTHPRPRSAAIAIVALAISACATTGATGELANTPFTAEQIREAFPRGSGFKFIIEALGRPAMHQTTTFVRVDEKGATIESRTTTPDGQPLGRPEKRQVTWKELKEHSRYPASETTISETSLEVPAGVYDCWLYTVRSTDNHGRPLERRFFFAKDLPGPPIHAETLSEGRRVLRMTLLERIGEPSAPHS